MLTGLLILLGIEGRLSPEDLLAGIPTDRVYVKSAMIIRVTRNLSILSLQVTAKSISPRLTQSKLVDPEWRRVSARSSRDSNLPGCDERPR